MKKVLFVTLAMAVAMTGFAQRAVVKDAAKNATMTAEKPSALKTINGADNEGIQFNMPQTMVSSPRATAAFDEYQTMTTNYDLQSNSALGNRIAVWADGSAAFTATWDHSGNTSYPDRGTGYNFYTPDAGVGDEPEARQETMRSGWPSIAACGDGELLASHATGTNVYYRPTKGEGEWTLIQNFANVTWPRIICSGANDQYAHLVAAYQESDGNGGYINHIYYARSTDGGQTWSDMVEFPNLDNSADGDYRNQLSADDYVMAANGDNVAVIFGSYTTDVFYMISRDNGETWERQIVAPYPYGEGAHAYEYADHVTGMDYPVITGDNSQSIAIDDNGVVHVAFAMFRWQATDDSHYTYWPAYNYGIVYWNSEYTNEQGGHEIPLIGQWSGDVNFAALGDTLGYSLDIDRVDALCEADNYEHLQVFGYVDENGNGQMDYENVVGASWHYRSLGLATMPAISVDEMGNIAIAYSVWSETRICSTTNFSYRSAYVSYKNCDDNQWYLDVDGINLSEDFMHELDEVYSVVASPKGQTGTFWVMYSGDEAQGLYLDANENYPNSNGGDLTENYQYACLIRPENVSVNENQAINPMTAARVYPNPATDVLNIEVNASQASDMSISVYNIMGQNVMNQNTNITTGMNTRSINTSELTSGIYFVTVKANGFENTMKFIVK